MTIVNLKRVGPSTDAFKRGEEYNAKRISTGYRVRSPNFPRALLVSSDECHGRYRDWKEVDEVPSPPGFGTNVTPPDGNRHCRCVATPLTQPNENPQPDIYEDLMIDCNLKIETVTEINGKRADEYTTQQIIQTIAEVETVIEALEKVKTKSVAITKEVARHNDNIAKLVEIIDGRENATGTVGTVTNYGHVIDLGDQGTPGNPGDMA